MTKSDYNSEFEENRKEIDLGENTNDDLPSRVKLRQNKNATPKRKKKESRKGLTLINVVLVLFTLIPIGIFVYVLSDLYNPKEENKVNIDTSDVTFELGANQSLNSSSEVPVNDDENKKDEDSKSDEDSKKDEKSDSTKVEEKPEVTKKPEATQKPETKPEVKPEVKPEPKPEVKPDPKPDPKPEVKPTAKSHTVQPSETLYRISVNYYGSGSGVEKIKAANGLSSNSISVGQTLVIP